MVLRLDQLGENAASNDQCATLADALGQGILRAGGAYLHVPFCFHKCHYCDFYSIVDSDDRQSAFVSRLEKELAVVGPRVESSLTSIFIGGGTPTLLRVDLLADMLGAVRRHLPLADSCEWTIEANPETVDEQVAQALRQGGVTRASIGCQSFHPRLLQALERHHDPINVARAVDHLRAAGIDSINLDLIMGIPGSTFELWREDLEAALELEPQHLSCYGLQYEHNTPLTRKLELGRIQRIDQELEARMYEHTCKRLEEAGFAHYEISNWAQRGEECRHNLLYWRGGNWLAFGPSASGHLDGTRWRITPRLGSWLEQAPWARVEDLECLDKSTRARERLMLELRLCEGIAQKELADVLADADPGGQRERALERGRAEGLIEIVGGRVRLTRKGLLLADSLLCELV